MALAQKLKTWARALKAEVAVLSAAIRDPRTPWFARLLGAIIVAYAVSPIDLIPDFIPVLGFLDDAILLPLGIWAVRRMIPSVVLAEHRARVAGGARLAPSYTAAVVIVALWVAGVVAAAWWLWPYVVGT